MYKTKSVLGALVSCLFAVSVACAATPSEEAFLGQYGLQGKSVKEMVDSIDQSKEVRPLPYMASVTSMALEFFDGKKAYVYPLGDEFYLSIAPYVTYTHDCFNHSLSGCQGELANVSYQVTVKDDGGQVVFDKAVTSFSNGFYGLWLPRNISGTVEVEYNGKKGVSPFSTGEKSQTCMTTIELK